MASAQDKAFGDGRCPLCIAGTCLLTQPELLALMQRAAIVVHKLAKLLCTVSFSSAYLLFLLCFLLCQKTDKWLK